MKSHDTPILSRICACLISFLIVLILLISSIELVCYHTPNWFETEYTKYHVLNHLNREMTMDSVLEVTDEYMSYLRGNRKDLVVYSEIDGKQQEFFTNREKLHMADVRDLFIGALWIRRAAVIMIVLMGIYLYRKHRSDTALIMSKHFIGTTGVIAALSVGLALLVSSDFNKYFIIFHHMFFNNDLWLLNPREDDLINLLPESFFVDIATRIVIVFVIAMLMLIAAAVIYMKKLNANEK